MKINLYSKGAAETVTGSRHYIECGKTVVQIDSGMFQGKAEEKNEEATFPNVDAEELLLKLDSLGICASAGSACSSGSSKPSHVLTAIGLNKDLVGGSLRITFGEQNNIDEVKYLIDSIAEIIGR